MKCRVTKQPIQLKCDKEYSLSSLENAQAELLGQKSSLEDPEWVNVSQCTVLSLKQF